MESLEERCCPSGGSVDWSDPSISGAAFSLAVQSDGRIVAGGRKDVSTPRGTSQNSALFRYNSDGTIDSTFGSGGVVLAQPKAGYGPVVSGVAIQTDGKIVAAAASGTQFFVMRFNANGSFDTTFGGGKKPTGIAQVTVSTVTSVYSQVSAVALQGDGKIVVSGMSPSNTTGADFCVVRLTSTGTLDSTFGSAGIVTTDLGGGDISHALTIQGDGKLLVAGESRPPSGSIAAYEALVRYNSNGTLDTTFGTGGKLLFVPSGTNGALAGGIVVQSNGSILISGVAENTATQNFFFGPLYIARYSASGQLDTTFGNSGFAFTSAVNGDELNVYTRIVIDAYGGLVVCGTDTTASNGPSDFVVARFLSTGALDTTFGVNGIGTANLGANAYATAMALQNNGNIVLVGKRTSATGDIFAMVSFLGGSTTSLAPASTPATSPSPNTASSTQGAAPLDAFWATDARSFTDKLIGASAA